MTQICLPDFSFVFEHQKKPGLRRISLVITREGRVILRSHTRLGAEEAKALVAKKASWIKSKLSQIESSRQTWRSQGPGIWLFGRFYPLVFEASPTEKEPRIELCESNATLFFHPEHKERIDDCLDGFYYQKASKMVLPLVEKWSSLMDVRPCGIKFRRYKSRWGSCSRTDILSFNTLVAKLPVELAEYIVVHELAHIRYKNHSLRFWQEVATYLPEHKVLRSRLRELERSIVAGENL